MTDVNVTVIVQAADILDAYETKWRAEAKLEVLRQFEDWLLAELGGIQESINFERHWSGAFESHHFSRGARGMQEELGIQLRKVREEMKRVSNLCQGRDSDENQVMSSLSQLIANHKEA